MKFFGSCLLCVTTASVLVACSPAKITHQFEFSASYGAEPLRCGAGPNATSMTDLRWFIHDALLVDSAGRPVPLQLVPDGIWQSAEVALIDLEDGSGDCQNGTPEMNTKLIGLAPDRNYRELRFKLGVPADLNHADPLTATSPLTSSPMHWHWRSGYKFLRAGVKAGNDGFRLHLGSAGCHGVIGNLTGCDAGNRPAVKLSNLQSSHHRIVFDLAALLANVNLEDSVFEVCEMGPDDPCDAVVDTLGLNANGDSVVPTDVFRLAR